MFAAHGNHYSGPSREKGMSSRLGALHRTDEHARQDRLFNGSHRLAASYLPQCLDCGIVVAVLGPVLVHVWLPNTASASTLALPSISLLSALRAAWRYFVLNGDFSQ